MNQVVHAGEVRVGDVELDLRPVCQVEGAPFPLDLIRDRGHVQGIVLRMGVGVDAAQQFHPPRGVRTGAIPHGLLVQLAEERILLIVEVARRQSARPRVIWFVPGWSRDGECAAHRDAGARGNQKGCSPILKSAVITSTGRSGTRVKPVPVPWVDTSSIQEIGTATQDPREHAVAVTRTLCRPRGEVHPESRLRDVHDGRVPVHDLQVAALEAEAGNAVHVDALSRDRHGADYGADGDAGHCIQVRDDVARHQRLGARTDLDMCADMLGLHDIGTEVLGERLLRYTNSSGSQ